MEFVLLYGQRKRFQFPVNPEVVTINLGREYQEVEVLQLGQVAVPQGMQLSDISFKSFFPRDYAPDYCEYRDIPDPDWVQNLIQGLMASNDPIRFIITGTWVNIPATIRQFNRELRGGEPGDIYFEIRLAYHRDVSVRVLPTGATVAEVAAQVTAARPDHEPVPRQHVVVSGDSLYAIAKRYYGDGTKWRQIYDLNVAVIGKNPNLIFPGQSLVLPS